MPIAWFGRDADIFTVKPFELPGLTQERLMRGVSFLRVVGRLKPGVTIDQAKAALQVLQQSYRQQRPDNADNTWSPVVISAAEDATGESASRVFHPARRGQFRFAHRVQQRRESAARQVHRPPARDRVADGAGRVARVASSGCSFSKACSSV